MRCWGYGIDIEFGDGCGVMLGIWFLVGFVDRC